MIIGLIAFVVLVGAMRPTKTYERAMTNALKAEEELYVCRSSSTAEILKDAFCFETALQLHPYNASWWKQLGALRFMSSQLAAAAAAFNSSAQTILESQGFAGPNSKAQALKPATMLKMYRRREPQGGYELAKVWFEANVLRHRFGQAHNLLTEFMDLLYPDDRTYQYRELGVITDVAAVRALGKRDACKFCLVVEEIPFAVERWSTRMLSSAALVDESGQAEGRAFMTKLCGYALPYTSRYTSQDLVKFITMCITKSVDVKTMITTDGERKILNNYLALDRTVVHLLASLGADYLLRLVVTKFPQALAKTDNFGRTALHYAAASRHASTFALLASVGGDTQQKDAGGISPWTMACATMREEIKALAPPGVMCNDRPAFDSIIDEDSDDVDGSGGGFEGASHREDSPCPFDARTVDGMSHQTMVGEFLLASRPMIIKGFDIKAQKLLHRAKLRTNHASVWVREELHPLSEHFGVRSRNSNISIDSVLNATLPPRFHVVECTPKHPLFRTTRFIADPLVPKSEGYTKTKDSSPLFILAGVAAASCHSIADSHVVHFVAHGRVEFVLRPPSTATASRVPVALNISNANDIRCTVQGGDAIVIPSLWSRGFVSMSESVSVERRFYWR